MTLSANPPGTSQLALWPLQPGVTARLRHSRRARRVAVRIDHAGQVELVVPRGVSELRARAFLESRLEWVRRQLQRRVAVPPAQAFPPARIELTALNESWQVFLAGGVGRPRLRERGGNLLEIRGTGPAAQLRRQLLRWLALRAQRVFAAQLQVLAAQHGLVFAAVKVRRQRTRWGSCSARGVISLNLALLFQSPAVLRYLLCHELAHTRHMNHSVRFWRCVADMQPGYRTLDAELCRGGWQRVPAWLGEA